MKYKFTKGAITRNLNNTYALTIELGRDINPSTLNDMIQSDKLKVCTIEFDKKKRSLTANGSLWLLLDKMASVLKTTKEELYLTELKRYGVFEPLTFRKKAHDIMKRHYKLIHIVGETITNGVEMYQAHCYYGTSVYDSKQFARLLDGVIEDAKDLGIDFISKDEQERLIRDYE